jgi:polysaccharide biosynthesis protein PslH
MKSRLLFISPVVPSPYGPGLAMRPYFQIRELVKTYSIHLLVAGAGSKYPACCDEVGKYCDQIDYICRLRFTGWRFSLWHRLRRLADRARCYFAGELLSFVADAADANYLRDNKTLKALAGKGFDRAHVFRLYLAPIAEILKTKGLSSFYSLDIDDIESETRKSIGDLYAMNGDHARAARLKGEAAVLFEMEKNVVPGFDQIFTCSGRDLALLKERFPDRAVTVLPNVVPVPETAGKRRRNEVFTMLFVGTLGYYPNTDALLFFADRIAPILRKNSCSQWCLRVVGNLPDKAWTKRFSDCPEMEFAGDARDLSREYDGADIVVVPIRGGGGTRIKILEAFAHRVPVVSTSTGAYGLEVENGIHIHIEDDPALFAEACIRLMTGHATGDEMSRRAFSLVSSTYSPDIINRAWSGDISHG